MRVPTIDESDLIDDDSLDDNFDLRLVRWSGDHSRVRGEGSISRSVADGASLADATLSRFEILDSVFIDADFSNATVEAFKARRTEFRRCRMAGFQAEIELVEDVAFLGCRLDYAILDFQRISGTALFRDCSFRDASIRGRLNDCVFQDCNLSGVEFEASSAAHCDLTASKLAGVRGLATLRGARIGRDQILSAAELLLAECGLEIAD